MLEITNGDIVQSICGRDCFQYFVVLKIENDYAFLVNGKNRTIQNPKRKKLKHIRLTNINSEIIKQKIISNEKLLDSEIRKAIDNLSII